MRFRTGLSFDEITKQRPEKGLSERLNKSGGRNNTGRVTAHHRGGGHKRLYRLIDFKRNKDAIPGTVATIEYDPNRTSNIALIHYADGEKRYIIAPKGLKVGDVITSGPAADIKTGNALPLENIPTASAKPSRHSLQASPQKSTGATKAPGEPTPRQNGSANSGLRRKAVRSMIF